MVIHQTDHLLPSLKPQPASLQGHTTYILLILLRAECSSRRPPPSFVQPLANSMQDHTSYLLLVLLRVWRPSRRPLHSFDKPSASLSSGSSTLLIINSSEGRAPIPQTASLLRSTLSQPLFRVRHITFYYLFLKQGGHPADHLPPSLNPQPGTLQARCPSRRPPSPSGSDTGFARPVQKRKGYVNPQPTSTESMNKASNVMEEVTTTRTQNGISKLIIATTGL